MKSRFLRISRIVVSMSALLILTASLTLPALTLPLVAPWIAQIQLVPALMAFSFATFAVWLGITLLLGRVYCSTICPLGTVQDIAARLARPWGKPVYRYSRPRNNMRYLFLVVMLACMMMQNVVAVALLDPFSSYAEICSRIFAPIIGASSPATVLLPLPATVMALVVLSAAIVLAVRSGRTLCNTLCPVGTALGLVSRFAVFHIDINTDRCTNCGRCADACKSSCIDLRDHVVDGSRCVNCFDCLTACHDDAIHYTSHRHRLSTPLMQRIVDRVGVKDVAPVASLNINTQTDETIS